MTKLEKLIDERNKLKAAWQANRKERGRIEMKLDRCTTNLSKAAGLEALLDPVSWKRS
jgi:hypothetical protein